MFYLYSIRYHPGENISSANRINWPGVGLAWETSNVSITRFAQKKVVLVSEQRLLCRLDEFKMFVVKFFRVTSNKNGVCIAGRREYL